MKRSFLSLAFAFFAMSMMAEINWRMEPLRVTARVDGVNMYIICHVDLDKPIDVKYDMYNANDSLLCSYSLVTPGGGEPGANHERQGYIIGTDTAGRDSDLSIFGWLTLNQGTHQPFLHKGDYILIHGNNPDGLGSGTFTTERHLTMNIRRGTVDVSGNIMSLIVGNEPDKLDTANYIPRDVCFARLFNQHPHAADPILDTVTTGPVDASNMILPAKTLRHACYDRMFNCCNLLKYFPELPAIDMAEYCYLQMFGGCKAATTPPATMDATNMAPGCCRHMFQDCKSLKSAPEMPATQLVSSCLYGMFDGCSNLRKIRVHFTEWGSPDTGDWMKGVSPCGTFYAPASLELAYGDSYIPNGWNLVAEEPEGLDEMRVGNMYQKVMRNGQIYILRADVLYDMTGRVVETR